METDHARSASAGAEEIIGRLLQTGVFLSTLVVLIGGLLYLRRFGLEPPHHRVFHGEPPVLCSVPGILREALSGSSRGVIQAGLLLLIATPIARVIFSVWAFARERDRLYVAITLVVLATLVYSLVHPA